MRVYHDAECTNCKKIKPSCAKGLCRACYSKIKRTGTFDRILVKNVCKVDGCDKYVVTHGLCDKHRQRLVRNGHLDIIRPNDWGAREKHPLYKIWTQHRRFNHKHPLCAEWHKDFWEFANGIGERPSKHHHLRPIDNSFPISQDNWHWVERAVCSEHKEDTKAYLRAWAREDRKENPEKYKNQHLIKSFGIDINDYNRLHDSQRGLCKICFSPETQKNPKTGESMMLAVDHCHTTGAVRGLLCSACNKALGGFKDSIHLLESAIQYLKVGSPLTDYNGQQTGAKALL